MGGIGMILNKMQPGGRKRNIHYGICLFRYLKMKDRKQEKHGWLTVTISGGWWIGRIIQIIPVLLKVISVREFITAMTIRLGMIGLIVWEKESWVIIFFFYIYVSIFYVIFNFIYFVYMWYICVRAGAYVLWHICGRSQRTSLGCLLSGSLLLQYFIPKNKVLKDHPLILVGGKWF